MDFSLSPNSTSLNVVFNLTLSYREYCDECSMKPCSQKSFVQQIMATCAGVTRAVDKLAKRRTLCGIRSGDILG